MRRQVTNNIFQFVQMNDKQNSMQMFIVSEKYLLFVRYRNGAAEKS